MAQHRFVGILIGLGMLGACGDANERKASAGNDNGTDMTLRSENGSAMVAADGDSGTVKLDLPGIKGELNLPKLRLNAQDMDIDGVALYPGSQVTSVDVRDGKDDKEGSVAIKFEAPQKPDVVRAYFIDAFKQKGMTASAQGSGLAGADKDGEPFTIDLAAGGPGTQGVIHMGSKKGDW